MRSIALFRIPFPSTWRSMSWMALVLLVAGSSISRGAAEETCLPTHVPDATIERSEVPEVFRWNLDPLFPSDADWEAERSSLESEVDRLAEFEGRLGNPRSLKEGLELYFQLHDRINHLTLYANLRQTTGQRDDVARALQQKSLMLMDELTGKASFIRAELLGQSEGAVERAIAAEPGLESYRPYIENIVRRRARMLPAEAESVLTLAGDNLWAEIDLNEIPSSLEAAFGALLGDIPWPRIQDETGQEVQLTLSNYGRYRASADRRVRRDAVAAMMGTLRQYQHTFAATLNGQFELDVFYARARHYDRAVDAYLDKDGLSAAVLENLITTVNNHLEPLHRYVDLRKKALGFEDLHLYDLYIPMVSSVEQDIPFAEAQKILLEALQPLGQTYFEILETGLDPANGWMDLYPHMDKQSGAFSGSVYGRNPYIMMNYQDSLGDMSTLAHEFGHAVHSHLAMASQPYSSFRYVPFLAEIASTCNEVLLNEHLVGNAESDAERAYLLTDLLETIRTTIYRQTLFAEFELVVHGFVEDGVPVTAKLLDQTYRDLVVRYYGPGFTVDENDGMEWAYVSHFYYKYYVFSYATGLSSGIALADRVRSAGPEAVEAYLGMLKAGNSAPPLELLKAAGVDLTRPEAIRAAVALFERTLEELEGLLGKG